MSQCECSLAIAYINALTLEKRMDERRWKDGLKTVEEGAKDCGRKDERRWKDGRKTMEGGTKDGERKE